MLGSQPAIRLPTAVSLASPPAPSPAAATVKVRPGAGLVPGVGDQVLVFTGGVVMPLVKVSPTDVGGVVNVSRISASADKPYAPSTNFVVGSTNV